MVAERTRLAREEQKKAAEAYHAENEAKAATEAPEPAPTTEGVNPKSESPKSGGLSANQWIAIGSICVSLFGIYYNREELKAMAKPVCDKFKTPEPASVERSQNLLARHGQEDLKKCFEPLRVMYTHDVRTYHFTEDCHFRRHFWCHVFAARL